MQTRIEILKWIYDIYSKNCTEELVSSTEMFDTSDYIINIPNIRTSISNIEDKTEITGEAEFLKGLSLPFSLNLIKMNERDLMNNQFHLENHVFIHELKPNHLIGFLFCTFENRHDKGMPIRVNGDFFHVKDGKLVVTLNEDEKESEKESAFNIILRALLTLDKLNECKVYNYTRNDFRPQYLRKKKAKTVKIENRPIYYVINKKSKEVPKHIDQSKGKLSCSYAFKVRGHWRRLHNEKSFGMNREGERVVLGHTWIKEFIKGNGELIRRVHLVK